MGVPVKIADELVKVAQDESKAAGRSMTKQIEHWAQVGRAVEALLRMPEVLALKRAADDPAKALAVPRTKAALETIIRELIDSSDRSDIAAYLRESQQPIYAASDRPGQIVQVRPSGRRVRGRIVNRKFVADRA
jgi:ParD-like antitoxin of type II bacterial toxin-antitoxin system